MVSDRCVKVKFIKEFKIKMVLRYCVKEGIYIDFFFVVIVKCNFVFIFVNIDVFEFLICNKFI